MKRRNLLFLLPNLFTVSSIFCGVYAVVLATDGSIPDRFLRAGVAILFGVLFDTMDGRVARMTKTESDFGIQLDSLADVITFGVAPAILVYKWALVPLGIVGVMVAFVFATCGALRLARFNVMATKNVKSSPHFVGLPIPLGAAGIVALVLLHHHLGGGPVGMTPAVVLTVLIISALMVSRIRYRTFKKVKASGRALPLLIGLVAGVAVASYFTGFGLIFALLWGGWVAFGMAEEVWRLFRRALHARASGGEDEK